MCAKTLLAASLASYQSLLTRGSAEAKANVRDFGHVKAKDTLYIFG